MDESSLGRLAMMDAMLPFANDSQWLCFLVFAKTAQNTSKVHLALRYLAGYKAGFGTNGSGQYRHRLRISSSCPSEHDSIRKQPNAMVFWVRKGQVLRQPGN